MEILKLYLGKYRDSLKNGEKGDTAVKKNPLSGSDEEEEEEEEDEK